MKDALQVLQGTGEVLLLGMRAQFLLARCTRCDHIAPEQITDITPIDSYPSLKTHVEMILKHERETKRRGIVACCGGAALGIAAIAAIATGGVIFAVVLALLSAYTTYWGYVRIA